MPADTRKEMVKKVLADAKKQKLDNDTIATILADLTSKGAQPDTTDKLSPYEKVLMGMATRDVQKQSDTPREVDAGAIIAGKSKGEDRSGRDLAAPALKPEFTTAEPYSTRVAPRTFEDLSPGGMTRNAQAQARGNEQQANNRAALTLQGLGINPEAIARNIAVRGNSQMPPVLDMLQEPVEKPELRKGSTQQGKKERDPGEAGTLEKLLPFLGLAGLVGAAVARHNEGPKTSGTTVQNLSGGGRMITTQQQGPQLSDFLLGSAQAAGGLGVAMGERRESKQKEQEEMQRQAIELELTLRAERQKTAGLLLKAGLKEPAVAMIQMDNPELADLDFSKMTEDQALSQKREALDGLMKPSVYTRLDPDVQESVLRDYYDSWGMTLPKVAYLVAREDPSKAMSSTIAMKMLTMGIMLPENTLRSLRIPTEQANAYVEASRISQTMDEKKAEFSQLGQLARMIESTAISVTDKEQQETINEIAKTMLPRLQQLSKEVGRPEPLPADFAGPSVTQEAAPEPIDVEEAIEYLRDPIVRNYPRAWVEQTLRNLSIDLSDPRILNELDALVEE